MSKKRANLWKKATSKGKILHRFMHSNLRQLHRSKKNHQNIIVIGQIKTLNRNIFRSIYINLYQKKIVIENQLSILYRWGKSMHYPESPKVNAQ